MHRKVGLTHYSQAICEGVTINDLDKEAIAILKEKYARKRPKGIYLLKIIFIRNCLRSSCVSQITGFSVLIRPESFLPPGFNTPLRQRNNSQ